MKKRKVLAYLFASLLFSTALFSCGNKKPDNYNEEIYRIYELAKEDGYQGTYEEWLDSIKGEKGDTGSQGEKGEKGDPGTPGKDGEDGHTPVITIGSNGNWFIDGVDTNVKAQGEKGDTGSQGEKGDKGDSGTPGKDGEDGHTPVITIGENGNWYVDGVDTGVKAQGEKGDTGSQGEKGDKGDSGKDGTSILTGNGRPTNDKGINGDSFIDLSSWDFYIKVNDKWTLKGNIKGDSTGETPIYNTEGLVFTPISDTECSVSLGKGKERFLKEIYIPSTYEDYVVTKIEDGVDMDTGEIVGGFAGLSCLEKVYIPNTVNYIGMGAFAFCNNLKEVVFEEGIEIESLNNAFIYCSNLPHFEIPEGVTKLNDAEFYGCDLSSLIIPSSIESVGYSAISSYQLYRSIYYRGTIEDWLNIEFDPGCLTGEDGLLSMYLLTEASEWVLLNEVVIPENITEANLYSFSYFYGVSDIEIHKDVKTIYSSSNQFQNIYFNGTLEDWLNVERSNRLGSNLYLLDNNGDVEHNGKKYSLFNPTELVIPDGVTEIKPYAFSNCSSLESVVIPNTVTSIGNSAFSYCSSLTSITIPDSVTSIGNSAFSYCSSLTSITIPDSVTSIGNSAFSYCSSLTSITIPNSVTNIGTGAFYECSSLEKANIPTNAIDSIPKDNLKEVIINGGTTIDSYAFRYCRLLESVTISNSVTSIGNYAFYNCPLLENIYYNGTVADWCKINFEDEYSNPVYATNNGCLYFLDENGDVECNGKKYVMQDSLLVVTSDVTQINQYAFYGCNIWYIHYDGYESDLYKILYNGSLYNVFYNSDITVYALNTIEQVRSEGYNNKFYNIKGIVIENYSVGYVVYDGTGFITVYLNDASPYKIGEYLHIKGYISTYGNSPQFTSEAVVSILDESVPEYINIENEPDLTITEEYISNVMLSWKDNYNQPGGVYGTLEGTLTKEKYYSLSTDNLTVS